MADTAACDPIEPDLAPGADALATPASPGQARLQRPALAVGSTALLLAMATDAVAVAGRHLGVTVLGSIEIVQACIVVAATAALVATTATGAHARVHIVIEKVRPATARLLDRAADAASAALFLWLAAGSAWIAADLWSGVEVTEILGLPLRWLRAVWIVGALVIAVLFTQRALLRRPT